MLKEKIHFKFSPVFVQRNFIFNERKIWLLEDFKDVVSKSCWRQQNLWTFIPSNVLYRFDHYYEFYKLGQVHPCHSPDDQ